MAKLPPTTIDEALLNPELLGAALGDSMTWQTWRTILKGAFALELNRDEARAFASVAGGRKPPPQQVRELWCLVGRRGGKSKIAAALAVYQALFVKHKLGWGEKGVVLVLAMSLDQAKVVFDYAVGFLTASEHLAKEIVSTTTSEIRLRSGITIAVHANSYRSVRGRNLLCVIFDEVAFWRDDRSANPDLEVYTAILPSLLAPKGSPPRMLIGISSAYRRAGLLHQKYRDHFGVDTPDILVVKGTTAQFNQAADEAAIAAMRVADPTSHRAEWDSEFRDDLSGFLDEAAIDHAVNRSRPLELPPVSGVIYQAHCDASGGAISGSGYSLCIGHKDGGRFVIDVVRVRYGPFNPYEVTKEYAALCKQYGVTRIHGDKYAKEWTQSAWSDAGLVFVEADLSASDLYGEAEPIFMRGLIELPPHEAMIREFRLLERDLGTGGKETIGHPRGVFDDMANAVCGCLRVLAKPGFSWDFVDHDKDDPSAVAAAAAMTEKEREAQANYQWRLNRYMHEQMFGGGIRDNRNLLYGGGRQIDWAKM
jgi:hypothetical protein